MVETNADTINLEDPAYGYMELMVIKSYLRSLKGTRIKMTSKCPWERRRNEPHKKIFVLMERISEKQCDKPWHKIATG
jgi:hypothetical protein